jgi:hypothetical protein
LNRLEENLKADKLTLSADNIKRIRDIINTIEVHGERYDEKGMQVVNI